MKLLAAALAIGLVIAVYYSIKEVIRNHKEYIKQNTLSSSQKEIIRKHQ